MSASSSTTQINTPRPMSLFAAPITILIPMLARALIMAGLDPYNRTSPMAVDWSSFAVANNGGRLSATYP
ncbi:hypothetical protein SESBI_06171 [Sesbania bispinosa]|nr:hypothetical protein SESBI_06171 [Sesbania bispinosa]